MAFAGNGGFYVLNNSSSVGVELASGASSWSSYSSRELKDFVGHVDHESNAEKLHKTSVERWRYKADTTQREQIGLYAEDAQQFGLGDGKTLSTLEIDGITLSALKGALIKIEKLEERIAQLEARAAAR
jgi:hypothetical protein